MPEMPEVQAHAERLTDDFAGDALSRFRPITFTALKTFSPAPDEAVGHPLVDVGRRGKYLLLRFEPVTFVVHLMQGGRLKPDEKQAAKPRGGQARWTFADGRATISGKGTSLVWYGAEDAAASQLGQGIFLVNGTTSERYDAQGNLVAASARGRIVDVCAALS